MLCQLDDFEFESSGVNLAELKNATQYHYEQTQLINDFDHWQSVAKFSQTISLSGSLIKQSNYVLHDLQQIAQNKQVVTLAFDNGQALSVLILEITTDKSAFLNNGAFLKQDFEVSLGVVYGAI